MLVPILPGTTVQQSLPGPYQEVINPTYVLFSIFYINPKMQIQKFDLFITE